MFYPLLLSSFYTASVATAILVGATTHMQARDPTMHMLALRHERFELNYILQTRSWLTKAQL